MTQHAVQLQTTAMSRDTGQPVSVQMTVACHMGTGPVNRFAGERPSFTGHTSVQYQPVTLSGPAGNGSVIGDITG
ncbi:hypothetical protein RNH31_005323, partial [Salmonella enterica]|nr:hypothetical protein [Salmonella enterica]ELF4900330.1 hypothetical protein [Salmonella enterica]